VRRRYRSETLTISVNVKGPQVGCSEFNWRPFESDRSLCYVPQLGVEERVSVTAEGEKWNEPRVWDVLGYSARMTLEFRPAVPKIHYRDVSLLQHSDPRRY